MTPPVTELMMEGGGGGAGGRGGGGRVVGGAGRESSGRGFLGRPRFRFTGVVLVGVLLPMALPLDTTTSRGRLAAPPRTFWTTEVGAEGACCC